jgi:hypothetical protein
MNKTQAKHYMEWFQTDDVIVVYPVYMIDTRTQSKRCTGYRATINIPYKRLHPKVYCEMNADDHTLMEAMQYVKGLTDKHPDLRSMRVMYVDSYFDLVENEIELDLTNEDTMLMSILRVG